MELVLIIIGALIFIASIVVLLISLHKFNKSLPLGGAQIKVEGNNRIIFLCSVVAGGLGFLLLSLGMVFFNGWNCGTKTRINSII